jgi:hypothetical protein
MDVIRTDQLHPFFHGHTSSMTVACGAGEIGGMYILMSGGVAGRGIAPKTVYD